MPEPPDADLQRASDDRLEAVESNAQQARSPELELRELILRKHEAPESARPWIEREIDAALERIAAVRRQEARLPDEDGSPKVVYRAVPKRDDKAAGGDT